MHTEISYRGDNSGRRAINDLIRWFGLGKSKYIFRACRQCKTMQDLNCISIGVGIGGVSGEPVRRLIAYCHGEETLARWIKSPDGSQELI
jgi:hypothetical protein